MANEAVKGQKALEALQGILKVCKTDHAREYGLGWEATRELTSILEDFLSTVERI